MLRHEDSLVSPEADASQADSHQDDSSPASSARAEPEIAVLRACLLQAAALRERRPDGGSPDAGDSSIVRAWSDRALAPDTTLDSYLSVQCLDREGLTALLTGGRWSPRERSAEWIDSVEDWLITPVDTPPTPFGPLIVEGTRLAELPFDGLLAPILHAQQGRFDRHPDLAPAARTDLLTGLAEILATLALRCLLAELAHDDVSGAYARLNTALSLPYFRRVFFSRYPVLARDLVAAISSWGDHVERILTRLSSDTRALRDADLLPRGTDALEAVHFAGDAHDDGQSVAILRFASGHRLVYKPRDCRVFTLYEEVNAVLAEVLQPDVSLYSPRSLVRDGYGWVEYVERPDATADDPRTHLRKLGGLLAVTWVLGASDMHLENVIATAAGPVPVDLETLIQNRSHRTSAMTASARAIDELNSSVLGTGILPVRLTTGESSSIDVSVATGGLGSEGRTAVIHQVVGACTDDMRISAVDTPVGTSQNQPPGMTLALVRAGREVIAAGFAETVRAVIQRRAAIIDLLSTAPSMTARHILRATRSYSLLLTEMRQPGRLRTGIDRDHLLRSLWTRLADHPDEAELIDAEERSLRRRDVPLFTTSLDSRALTADHGRALSDYFTRTLRDDVIARLTALDEASIERSIALIRESILAASPGEHEDDEVQAVTPRARSTVRELARAQAGLLANTAILGDDDVTWISVCSSTDSTGLEYRPVGPTLYDGLAGIAFSAACAHRVFPHLGLDDLAGRASHAIAAILDDWSAARVSLPIGAFSGASGLLYSLARQDSLLGTDRYRTTRLAAIRQVTEGARSDTFFDVMAGSAGALAVLTSLPESETEEGRTAVRTLAEHLLENAVDAGDGALAWESGTARVRLGGFSHGSTGIGWALARAADALDDREIGEAALAALRFDDTLFDPRRGRWLDARTESLEQGRLFPAHWCHGTAGIAMARAASAALLDAPDLLERAVIGANQTTDDRLPADDSLCHGALGNLLALRAFDKHAPGCVDVASFAERTLDRIGRSAARSGLPRGITTVRGLLLGTAGALSALCRELDPDLPNVLLLE
ncbi:type 2 lanthipeptide synthetase LanM [Rathayibacter iranicus]|uniref:Type 2 lantipeptide synthetase LanM n=2 Tax=Rathayibacter iranicus TaxID=59737 RepID=A0AAD1AEW5_9MICO|nr:type 2 lanthipeptide synthetase LanM [Rathayibacter iranicus]AZZ56973.1 type 2 lantipeptide synthetase LanM [Rathayibacter iranicus]MWV29579.1 type 2 lantipeptide synthetase LanM [Rathayibacter iranicus NCPPB 2253 = VKM Ac-1602]PPI41897.1 hypothetical protein C5E09_13480 [Rathayibacter iranicus]PPI57637.1 hypothetical protein C5E08_14380 [Rathayibacter iranicus]PPI68617.1 hypothetical protein C5E01_13435 [Rathayibacter iranicus]